MTTFNCVVNWDIRIKKKIFFQNKNDVYCMLLLLTSTPAIVSKNLLLHGKVIENKEIRRVWNILEEHSWAFALQEVYDPSISVGDLEWAVW